jgi:hypothetical protein
MVCLGALSGCTGSSTDVQDLGDGTYRIGVRYVAMEDQEKALTEALRKGDQYCQSKGQRLQSVPNPGSRDVTFRCVGADEAFPAEGQRAD